MKIISYNIHHCTQEKVDSVLRMQADIYILPEMSHPQKLRIPNGFMAYWRGNIETKGLGIVFRKDLECYVPDWTVNSQCYFLPLIAEKKLIIGAWPTKRPSNEPKGYPQIALDGLAEYASRFEAYPTLIAGDFNLYNGQQDETEMYSLKKVVSFLRQYGMTSIYHYWYGEEMGKESQATYYHQFKKDQQFFLDYTFSNIPVKDYILFDWNPRFSDHVAQCIEI